MRVRPKRTVLLFTACALILVLLSTATASAQSADEWFGDENITMYIAINGISITKATQANPIVISLDDMTTIMLQANITSTKAIYNLTGSIGFFYQGVKVFSMEIKQNITQEIHPGTQIEPTEAEINLGQVLSGQQIGIPLDLATGIFQASVEIRYYLAGDDYNGPPTHSFEQIFYLLIPPSGPAGAIGSVAGVAATVATVGAVTGLGSQIYQLLDGIQTAHKIRSIQKKVSEIRSLPNLAVIGALPTLFSIFAGMRKMKRKKKAESESVAEYRLKQRLRESAPALWPMDRCPKCGRKWDRKRNFCKKCKISEEEAREAYAELLVAKVPRAIKALGKKKALSVRKLAKKTKSNQYNAGVIGAAMVETGLAEVTKVETPIRGFVTNLAGLAFLVITWQQLLGGASSQWQTTLTIIGAALSLAVIITLYIARKTQIEKLKVAISEVGPEAPAVEAEPGEAAPADTGETEKEEPSVTEETGQQETEEPRSEESTEEPETTDIDTEGESTEDSGSE
ncbi:MAG: hypothetical protein ACTSPE_07750 [Candidatus Thorarchaeota archaeon]